jgi:hypothetical protein
VTNFFSGIQQDIGGLYKPTGTVGSEQPEWDFPQGKEAIDDDVMGAFFRGDFGPTGLNEFLQKQPPEVVDRFRAFVNAGIIRPKNAAAGNIVKGYGGLRAGDEAGPGGVLGAMQDDMPSGLSPEYWAQANNLISTMVNAKLEAAKQSGYLDGVPTMQRDEMLQQLAQGWKAQFTDEFRAQESKRANQAQEGLSQQEINNQNMQAMAGLMGGMVGPNGEFQQTEQGRQFDISQQTEQGGWMPNGQATLGREQQAWNQAKDVAALASNPRNYMEAQMLGNARGGLGGMQPTNQINADMTQTGQPGANPLARMNPPGVSGAGTLQREGGPGMPGADGTTAQTMGPENLNGGQWSNWLNQANALQGTARDAMLGGQAGAAGAASGLSPGPGSPGMVQPYGGYQGAATNELLTKPMLGMGAQQFMDPGQIPGYQPGMTPPDGRAGTPLGGQGLTPMGGRADQMPVGGMGLERIDGRAGMTPQGGQELQRMQQLGGQYGALQNAGQQGFQMPGARQGQQAGPALGGPGAMPGQRPMGMAQPGTQLGQQQPGGQQYSTSAFSQALLKNRVVPQSGALQNNGAYMTQQQMQKEINPNKVRGQDFLRGRDSEQKGFLANTSAAGYSDEDALGAMQKNAAPAFKAPTAGRMI